MDARFAGSQRIGDRRRRRLAVETDEPLSEGAGGKPLAAPEGTSRTLHGDVKSEGPASAVPDLPLGGLVPAQWWKYLAGGVGGTIVSGSLLAAAWYESIWGTLTGTGIPRLFSLPDAPVAAWYSSLLLSLSAQLALLIWWGRSRSLKDFAGRYHVWTRTAGAWLLFGFCTATGAHESWSQTILHFWPQTFRNAGVLMWLLPAAGLGLNRLLALNREMTDCRASRSLLFTAAGLYAIAATLQLDFAIPVSGKVHQLLTAGSTLLGHLALFMSMWVHARHVLHFTADPSAAPRRKLRIPRPHFRLPRFSFGWKRSAKGSEGTVEPVSEKPSRRRKPRKMKPKDVEPTVEDTAPTPDDASAPAASRRTFRIDAKHATPARLLEPEQDVVEHPVEMPEETVASESDSRESATRFEQEEWREERPSHEYDNTAAPRQEDVQSENYDDEEQGDFGNGPKPDLRGMSKKQRRKILAELREKERANRRK